jgi:glycosyltransferase involved in cell wall biosynthesis
MIPLLGKLPNFFTDWTPENLYYHSSVIASLIFWGAFLPALLFAINVPLFRRPGREWNRRALPPVSVLIPARDEEDSIGLAISSVLASRGVDLELIVLDDGSTDRTAEIVQEFAEKDLRVRLGAAPPLPKGWNGKQHACWVLAGLAAHDVFCFLDADVCVEREAIYRMASEMNYEERRKPLLAMATGFPAQKTASFWERLLLPLINFVLLSYLPLAVERGTRWGPFAAGCGQFMMVRREAYFASGGHEAIRKSMHDGLRLPKLFRRHGFRTRVYDLSKDAVCRMYRGGAEVWRGLTKNATEGMATWTRLPVFTVLLLAGQVLPLPCALWGFEHHYFFPSWVGLMALSLGYGVRFFSAWRYKQSWLGVALHPVGVLMLLVLQWLAFLRKLFFIRATWKQRTYRVQ